MTPEMRKKLEEVLQAECDKFENPGSWGVQITCEAFWLGAQAYESLLAEMAGQDAEKAAEAFVRRRHGQYSSKADWNMADAFKAGDAHGYARAKSERIMRLKNLPGEFLSIEDHKALVKDHVKAERERCAGIALAVRKQVIHAKEATRPDDACFDILVAISNPPSEAP